MTGTASAAGPVPAEAPAILDDLARRRHSCRAFRSDPVPRDIIEAILRTAQRTASWCNSQPWQVVITEGAGTERFRETLYAHAASGAPEEADLPRPREYRGIYKERRRESGYQLYDAVGIERFDQDARQRQALENFRFFGAPHVALITNDEALGLYGAVDCGAYVGNFLLAAEAHGVATIAQAALARYGPFIRNYFGIGEDRQLVCGISFGYADPAHPINAYRTSRAELGDAVQWVDR